MSQRKPLITVTEIFVQRYSLFESFTINITFITENKATKDTYEKSINVTLYRSAMFLEGSG